MEFNFWAEERKWWLLPTPEDGGPGRTLFNSPHLIQLLFSGHRKWPRNEGVAKNKLGLKWI